MYGGPEGNYCLSRYLASTWVPMGAIYYAETQGYNLSGSADDKCLPSGIL